MGTVTHSFNVPNASDDNGSDHHNEGQHRAITGTEQLEYSCLVLFPTRVRTTS